jgi:glycosyltransferase involved in cell wall biosynthesis
MEGPAGLPQRPPEQRLPLRFLFVNIGYPPFQGGAQVYVQMLAERLVADGHEVTVLTTSAGEVEAIWDPSKRALPPEAGSVNGVKVLRFTLRHLPPAPYGYFAWRRLTVALAGTPLGRERVLAALAMFTPWCPGLQRALREWDTRPDVVHGFAIPFEPLLLGAEACARRTGAAFFVTPFLHTGPANDRSVERGYAMPHQVGLLRRARGVIALSNTERDFLVARGVDPGRVHAVPGGIVPPDGPAVEQDAAAPARILFLGAVTYDKGAVHLTEAVRRLWATGLPVELDVVGTVTGQYRSYIDGLPAADRARVQVRGVVPETVKQDLLARCTLLAMPSRVDSFGLVFLEAWSHGRPVIGARAGGIPDVIDDGDNGLLVPFGDVAALAAAIQRLAGDPALARRLGAAGRTKLHAHYTWDRVYDRLAGMYREAAPA